MFKDLPPYIKGNSKKAQENRTEMIFATYLSCQLLLNRIAKIEASVTKRPLNGVLADMDKEAERIAGIAIKELEAFYDEE